MSTYYARSIINGKEVANEVQTTLGVDHIAITIGDDSKVIGRNPEPKQLQITDLIKKGLFAKEITYQLKAAGVKTPIRKATIRSHEKTDEDHWIFILELK